MHKQPLALACAAALTLTVFAAPAWAASCTINDTTYANCTQGATGGNGGAGTATAGGAGGTGAVTSGSDANGGGAGGLGNGGGYSGHGTGAGGGGAFGAGGGGGAGGGLNNGGEGAGAGGGGAGGPGTYDNRGGGGGGGGGHVGGTYSASTTITLNSAVQGGSGGSGGSGLGGGGGGGGGGGAGVLLSGGTLTNQGGVSGGSGGSGGGNDGLGGGDGDGGSGGDGVLLSGSSNLINRGVVLGGNGGEGGNGNGSYGGNGGNSGNGGDGVSGTGFTLTNGGTINGGSSDSGGSGASGASGGNGGNGGAGVSGIGLTLTNDGTITGGSGGHSGSGSGSGSDGIGGAGVVSTGNSTITNADSISGGLAGDGTTRADAVDFSGGGNTLVLESGYSFSGNVVSSSGSTNGDTLALGGSSNATFDLSQIVTTAPAGWTGTARYYGFTNLAKTDSSTWIVTGSTASAAPWTISAGTLQVGSGSSSGGDGTLSSNVTNNAALVFDNTATSNYGGVISGSGTLTQQGTGTLTLTGANTYTGATTIDGGTLALSGSGSIAASSGVTDNGTFDIGGTTSGASIASLGGSGTVTLGNQTLMLTNADSSFDGTINGTGGLTLSSGTETLNGVNTYTGLTEVQSGTLEVGDAAHATASIAGNAQVDAGATLRGHGTILGNVANGGTMAPGGSIGTLTVGGNYTQAPGATLAIEVSPTAASQLKVDGSAALNGTLALTYDPGTYTARQYTLVSASSVNGTFSSVTSSGASNLDGLTQSINYDADSVDLMLSQTLTPTGTVILAPTDTSIYTALGTTALMNAQDTTAALLDRLDGAGTAGASQGWANLIGQRTTVGGTDGEPGFQASEYGFLAGFDKSLGEATMGVAGGYTHTDLTEQNTGDSGKIDTLRGAVYASRWAGPFALSAAAGYGLDFLSQKRPFPGIGTAQGDHVGQVFTTGAQAGLPMALDGLSVTPRLGLRYTYFHANGLGENGAAGQDLQVGTDTVQSLQPYVELAVGKTFGDADHPVAVQAHVGYAREMLASDRAVDVTAQDGTLFTAPGTSLPRGYLTTGASVSLHPAKHLTVSLGLDALIDTSHASAMAGTLQVAYQF